MTIRTTIRSVPAMLLAGIFLSGTSFVLFNDILFDGARITTGHVLTALALIAATAAGHQIVTMVRARRLGVALGMIVLTAAALAYVATMSGARNAEQATYKAERIDGSNADRAQTSFSATQAPDVQAIFSAPLPDNEPEPPKGRKTKRTDNVVRFPTAKHPVIRALETQGRTMSNGELATAMGVSDSEASKRWQEVADQLTLGWRGKYRVIGLKAWRQATA